MNPTQQFWQALSFTASLLAIRYFANELEATNAHIAQLRKAKNPDQPRIDALERLATHLHTALKQAEASFNHFHAVVFKPRVISQLNKRAQVVIRVGNHSITRHLRQENGKWQGYSVLGNAIVQYAL